MYCDPPVPQLDSILHADDLSPISALWYTFLTDLAFLDVKSYYSISNLSLKLRCDTIHLCQCTVFLKALRILVSDVSTYFAGSRGGPDGSVGKFLPLASNRKCADVLLVRLILQT